MSRIFVFFILLSFFTQILLISANFEIRQSHDLDPHFHEPKNFKLKWDGGYHLYIKRFGIFSLLPLRRT